MFEGLGFANGPQSHTDHGSASSQWSAAGSFGGEKSWWIVRRESHQAGNRAVQTVRRWQ